VYLKDIIAMFEKNLASTDLVQEGVLSLLKPIEELVMLFPNDVPQHFEMILQRLLSMIFDAKVRQVNIKLYVTKINFSDSAGERNFGHELFERICAVIIAQSKLFLVVLQSHVKQSKQS
jgi:hypothetical protein